MSEKADCSQISHQARDEIARPFEWLLLALLTRKEKIQLCRIGLLTAITGSLELVGIGLLLPVINVLSKPDYHNTIAFLPESVRVWSAEKTLALLILILAGFFVMKAILSIFVVATQRAFIARIEERFATKVFRDYLRQDFSFHSEVNSSRMIRDTYTSVSFGSGALDPMIQLFSDGVVLVSISAIILWYQPIPALTSLIIFGGSFVLLQGMSRRRLSVLGASKNHHEAKRTQIANEAFTAIREVKVYRAEDAFEREYQSHAKSVAEATKRYMLVQSIPRQVLDPVTMLAVSGLTLTMLVRGDQVSVILGVVGIFAAAAFRLMPGVNRIIGALQTIRFYRPYLTDIATVLLNLEGTKPNESKVIHCSEENVAQGVRTSQVCFKMSEIEFNYPGSDRKVLDGLSLEVPTGKLIGIVGASGSGKSTLVDILIGLRSPSRGTVEYPRDVVHEQLGGIAYVPQEIHFLDASLRANITFGEDEELFDSTRLNKAIRLSRLTDVVSRLDEGLESVIGEDGLRLSGGERQRIGLARALYRQPSLLLLDEATSSLDPKTEHEIVQTLLDLRGIVTVVAVTHRIAMLRNFDSIYVMRTGRLDLVGSFSQLEQTNRQDLGLH